jgi:hypothetical protein
MKLIDKIRGLNPLRYKKQILLLAITAVAVAAVVQYTSAGNDQYVSASPSITQLFTGVMSEKMLLDFCYQVRNIHGITGVSYRDYSAAHRTAMITVYYNPRVTSPRQVKIFLEHANILWVVPKAT